MTPSANLPDMPIPDVTLVSDILADAEIPRPSSDLKRAILGSYDAERRAARNSFGGLRRVGDLFEQFRIASASALAGLSLLGLASGVMTANAGAELTFEEELITYGDSAYPEMFYDNEELG